MFTISLHEIMTAEPDSIIFDGEFKTLFPPEQIISPDIEKNIVDHFYYRQIGYESPQRFLRAFHQIVRINYDRWVKLIASEDLITEDQGLYNYNMTEETTYVAGGSTENINISSATSDADAITTLSETPDNNIDDIDNYMSGAQKNKNSGKSEGTGKVTGTSKSDGTSQTTRRGNIGVMTSAQIIDGYRDSITWSAYKVIFRDLEKCFLGVF